ncbi:MAG: class IV adenylate cyclase [Armatimonadetes bacterium]|nr:class IV adenylate cyclase [Armatimonadota bacterium]
MPSNIEIKGRVRDLKQVEVLAAQLTDLPPQALTQEDVFFPAQHGRLKLRILSDDCGELIYYDRPDSTQPKQSDYRIHRTTDPSQLREVLSASLGEAIVVRKNRTVYLIGQTRVHLDQVEGLGDFVELEVVLRPGQNPEEGHLIARDLMGKLGIEETDLLPCAYADLLREQTNP